jgi:hypothetical protein
VWLGDLEFEAGSPRDLKFVINAYLRPLPLTRSRVRGGVGKDEGEGRELSHLPLSHPTPGERGGREGIGVDIE